MPLYPYRCTQCGHRFEKIQNFSAEPLTECPKCHGPLERLLTAPRLHFKGAGWYVNDYGGGKDDASSGSEPGSAAPAAKTSETKTTDSSASSSAPAAAPAASTGTSTPSSSS